jgi:hypothetical protein
VNGNDPTNAVLVVAVIDAGGETDDNMRDTDTFTGLFATTADEVTNVDYARKSLDNTAGITITYDDANNRVDVDVADQTFTGVDAGDAWTDVVFGYDSDSTGGNDSNVLPVSLHDFAVTPDGSDITVQINASGIWRAS